MKEEYVKCISLTNKDNPMTCPGEIGKIYKVLSNTAGNNDYRLVGMAHSVAKTRFELSTKEEYNIQEGILEQVIEKEDLFYLVKFFEELNIK